MKEKVSGPRKQSQEPIALKDPETEEVVTTSASIKAVSLKYCIDLLTNRPPKEDYEQIIYLKEQLHNLLMEENVSYEPKMTRSFFDDSLVEIKKK